MVMAKILSEQNPMLQIKNSRYERTMLQIFQIVIHLTTFGSFSLVIALLGTCLAWMSETQTEQVLLYTQKAKYSTILFVVGPFAVKGPAP